MAAKFDRSFSEGALKFLESDRRPWWTDLLKFRFPGIDGEPQMLFLAVRNGYLNAYAEGQSILAIKVNTKARTPRLTARIHHKFIDRSNDGQVYFHFDGDRVTDKAGRVVEEYVALDAASHAKEPSLEKWVRNAREYAKPKNTKVEGMIGEKQGIASIVARNGHVIDVEMGLPANADSPRVANRIDMAVLERRGEAIAVVFYEAKTVSNQSLRTHDRKKHVRSQLQSYEKWLDVPPRPSEVAAAYRHACRILIQLNDMRPAPNRKPIDPMILEAANGPALLVDYKPRLVVFGDRTRRWARAGIQGLEGSCGRAVR